MPVVSLAHDHVAEIDAAENIRLRKTVASLTRILKDTHAKHRVVVERLEARITALETENAELRATSYALLARLNKTDPSLSSNPPSSVPPHQRRYPDKAKSDRPPGKPRGANGAGAPFVEDPDKVEEHRPVQCSKGHALGDLHEVEARQVRDLEVRVVTTEHRIYEGQCVTCGEVVRSSFPAEASARVVWGDSVKAFALLLTQRGLLPTKASADVLAALGLSVSPTCLNNWRREVASTLNAEFIPGLRAALLVSPFLCVDETPLNVTNGAANDATYAHVATNGTLVYYHLGGRDRWSIMAGRIIGHYPGCAVHDHYKAYFSKEAGITLHQLCLAHLRRELKLVHQNFSPSDGRDHPQPWAREMASLLGRAIKERPSPTSVRTEYRALARLGCHGPKPDVKQTIERDAWNLARRLRDYETSVLRFLTKDGKSRGLPPTNNAAEQCVKPVKVRQRRSGCFRTAEGAREFLTLQSYLRSALQSGVEPLEALRLVLLGTPWMPTAA